MLGGLLALGAAFFLVASLVIEWVVPHVPSSWEARILPGLTMLRHAPETPKEHEQQAALEELLDRLVAHWPSAPPALSVGLLAEESPNALAVPGGLILVTTGLMDSVESANELAFVLGHELGHYHGRDHLRSLGRGLALAVLLGVIGSQGAPGDLVGASTELTARSFNRDQESAADAFGLALVEAEFGHVRGATDFFSRLPEPESALARALSSYLATHPLSESRIEDMRRLAAERGWSDEGELTPLPSMH